MTTLVASSIGIIAAAYAWAWRLGTVRETAQERYDREFHSIVGRLR